MEIKRNEWKMNMERNEKRKTRKKNRVMGKKQSIRKNRIKNISLQNATRGKKSGSGRKYKPASRGPERESSPNLSYGFPLCYTKASGFILLLLLLLFTM